MSQHTDKYVCALDAASRERAKQELHEDEKNRDGAIDTFRSWVIQQQWLNTPTDPSFLIKFLRTKKYSQLEARKTLENFWKKRQQNAEWYCNKNVKDSKIQELLKSGFVLRSPTADKEGRIWMFDRPGSLDIDKVIKERTSIETIFKIYSMVFDWLMMDERVQVNGICWIVDMAGTTMKHNTHMYTPSNMKRFMDLCQTVYPARVKAIHLYNVPPILDLLVTTGKSFMREKFRNRLIVHGKSLLSIYEQIDMSVLPLEYLPDNYTGTNSGSVSEITDYMIRELTSERVMNYVDNLSNKQYGVDLKAKPDDIPTESFRKLNVD